MTKQTSTETDLSRYHYGSAAIAHTGDYLLPTLIKLLERFPPPARVFELGCGNGAVANILAQRGYEVTAVDPSIEGINIAKDTYPQCSFAVGSAYDDLAKQYGNFEIVISLEVVEHVFYPRQYAATVASLLASEGIAIISTPYHGYIKNLALALMNKWDAHMDPLWDYGHIKLWSRQKLTQLFSEARLYETSFQRVGRIPPLAKSMILTFQKG
jgi:2-polyprenyl-6-hydroxyphenyl methylase/3-demethylubiquinone-9 3-methyltransferase